MSQIGQYPLWMRGENVTALWKAMNSIWDDIEAEVRDMANWRNPSLCPSWSLELLAWEWNLSRYPDEPESFWRDRLAKSSVFLRSAAARNGLETLLENLRVVATVIERDSGYPWDLVYLDISDQEASVSHQTLLDIAQRYGRTCRRYSPRVTGLEVLSGLASDFGGNNQTLETVVLTDFHHTHAESLRPGIACADFGHMTLYV